MAEYGRQSRSIYLAALLWLASAGLAQGQDKTEPAAPIPPQIATATKVFVSNAIDQDYQDSARTYNSLYNGLKKWGRYGLLATPAEADLIFELRDFGAPAACGETTPAGGCSQVTLNLLIRDRATRTILWSVNEPWGGAGFTEAGREQASQKAMVEVLKDLLVLATPGATASTTKSVSPSAVDGAQQKP